MAKGTLQIKYEKLVLDNLDLKERIEGLKKDMKAVCDYIKATGTVNKWKILNWLEQEGK